MLPASALVALMVAGDFAWPGAFAVDARGLGALSDTPRLRAVERLAARAGTEASPLLLPLLHDPEPGVRLFAARRLIRAGSPAAADAAVAWIMTPVVPQIDRPFGLDLLRDAPALSPAARQAVGRALQDSDASIRTLALEVLERHDVGPSLPAVLAAFDDDNREVRVRAVHLAAGSGDPRAALSLLGRLEDSDRQIRLDAIRGLGAHPAAVPALLRVAAEGTDDIRLAAVDALGASPGAAPSSTPLLVGLARRRPVDDLARHATLALGKLATPAAIAALISLTRSPPSSAELRAALRRAGPAAVPALMRELDTGAPTSAATAAEALGDIGDRRATGALAAALDRRPELSPTVLDAVARLADPGALPALARAAESPDVQTRRGALATLLTLGDARGMAVLDRSLVDPDARARELATRLAGALGARAAVSALVPLLADPDRGVRRAAGAALARLATPAHGVVTGIVAAIARTPAPTRDDDEWQALGAALEGFAEPADVAGLAAAFVAARGPERGALAHGLGAAGAARPITDRAVINRLLGAISEGGTLALAAADALAACRIPDGARPALAAAFAAAEPAVRARLCPAIARSEGGAAWLSAVIAAPAEPTEVRAAAAWALRGAAEAKEALAAAAEGSGPLAANARAARAARAPVEGAPPTFATRIRVGTPEGGAEAGRWISVSGPDGVAVWAMTDAVGDVRLEGLPGGPLELRVPDALLRRDAP